LIISEPVQWIKNCHYETLHSSPSDNSALKIRLRLLTWVNNTGTCGKRVNSGGQRYVGIMKLQGRDQEKGEGHDGKRISNQYRLYIFQYVQTRRRRIRTVSFHVTFSKSLNIYRNVTTDEFWISPSGSPYCPSPRYRE
jgi:hypothetical protein